MGNIIDARKIDLSSQDLKEIPSYIFKCRNLRELNLSNNHLREIPIELSRLKTIEKLDFSNNDLSQVLSKTFELKHLKVLNLSNNKLKSLPKQIGNLRTLKSLILAGNQLETLPNEISKLTQLKIINISGNKFKIFPLQLFNIPTIQKLWVGKNAFELIPVKDIADKFFSLNAFFAYAPNLQNITTDRNTLLLTKNKGNSIDDLKLMTYEYINESSKINKLSKDKEVMKSIFLSYSHNDEKYKTEIIKTINGLKNSFPEITLDLWSDDKIRSGQDWRQEIEAAVERAGIAILVLSRDFIASDFIMRYELPSILKNAEAKGTIVLCVVAGKSILNDKISKFQFVNGPEEPLKSLSEHQQDIVYTKLANDIIFYLN